MVSNVNGLRLEVEVNDAIPHVRVSMKDGAVVLDTDKLSITGLRNLAEALEIAAKFVYQELDHYWYRRSLEVSAERHTVAASKGESI